MQIIFLSGTKCLWLAQYVNNFLLQHKKCGPTQNILGPVEGQGNSLTYTVCEVVISYITYWDCSHFWDGTILWAGARADNFIQSSWFILKVLWKKSGCIKHEEICLIKLAVHFMEKIKICCIWIKFISEILDSNLQLYFDNYSYSR